MSCYTAMGDVPMGPKFGLAIMFLELAVPEAWEDYRRAMFRQQVGPDGVVLHMIALRTEFTPIGQKEIKEQVDAIRQEFPLGGGASV